MALRFADFQTRPLASARSRRAGRGVAAWFPRRILGPLGAFLTSRRVRHRHPNTIHLDHGFFGTAQAQVRHAPRARRRRGGAVRRRRRALRRRVPPRRRVRVRRVVLARAARLRRGAGAAAAAGDAEHRAGAVFDRVIRLLSCFLECSVRDAGGLGLKAIWARFIKVFVIGGVFTCS